MKAKRFRKWMVGGALGALTMFGGTVAAGDYPPSDTTPTTVVSASPAGLVDPTPAASALAATGSNSDVTLKVAAGSLVAGVGLVVVATRRRRPAPSA